MPIYEYVCRQCNDEVELLIRGSEVPICPACGGRELEKLLSVPATHSAGSTNLPVCSPPAAASGCGLPQCGGGGCAME
ncbi:MAG: zinc ribbon domain-containing protein [Pirellulaceae bacterium]|nr:zinc ribbon domain-containing protein [Pirellulaceae bacterium]